MNAVYMSNFLFNKTIEKGLSVDEQLKVKT